MPQSVAVIPIHLVFSVKDRLPLLVSPDLRIELFAYMATIIRDSAGCTPILINGVEDHVHVLYKLGRVINVAKVTELAKKETTKWLKKQAKSLNNFAWQSGYGAFGVSLSNVDFVKKDIQDQEEHHRKFDFKAEYRKLCEKHRVELDERYAWD
ncbi:MAG: transposase [Planctomycetaceae bacterium]|nr:transposase [Planctomycetaceae bacterium]